MNLAGYLLSLTKVNCLLLNTGQFKTFTYHFLPPLTIVYHPRKGKNKGKYRHIAGTQNHLPLVLIDSSQQKLVNLVVGHALLQTLRNPYLMKEKPNFSENEVS